jgi:hypothetical protein
MPRKPSKPSKPLVLTRFPGKAKKFFNVLDDAVLLLPHLDSRREGDLALEGFHTPQPPCEIEAVPFKKASGQYRIFFPQYDGCKLYIAE